MRLPRFHIAEDGAHQHYNLPIEYVGKIPGIDWVSVIVARLDETIGDILSMEDQFQLRVGMPLLEYLGGTNDPAS